MSREETAAKFRAILAREMAKPAPPARGPVKTRWHYRAKKRRKPDARAAKLGRATEAPRLSPSQREILEWCRPVR